MKVELDYRIPELPRPLEGNYQLNQDILRNLFNNAKIDRKFNHYLKDKSVIIVGPASYLKGTKKGAFIDSFDIVVRCNGFWKPPIEHQEDIGKKTKFTGKKAKFIGKKQKLVGLFVNADINVIDHITDFLKLDIIQLHGDEDAELDHQAVQEWLNASISANMGQIRVGKHG